MSRCLCATRFILLLVSAFTPQDANAQDITIIGRPSGAWTFDIETLRRLPPIDVTVHFMTAHGNETATYTGPTLWSVLRLATSVAGEEPRQRINTTLTVIGGDGYRAQLALGEIDPEFEGKPVIFALRRGDEPLDTGRGPRLIVPSDHRAGRSVRDVTRIELDVQPITDLQTTK